MNSNSSDNAFAVLQNDSEQIEILLARRMVQRQANLILYIQIALVVALPAALAVCSFYFPDYRAFTSSLALAMGMLDIFVLDRLMRSRLGESARLQEEFDCKVFGLPWNDFIAGKPIDGERVRAKADSYRRSGNSSSVTSWYPDHLKTLPRAQARLAAQRLNMLYDGWVRGQYRMVLVTVAILLAAFLIYAVARNGAAVGTTLLSILVPIIPIINWCSREGFRQHDALTRLNATKGLGDDFWKKLLCAAIDEVEAARLSRDVQNVSFIRRSNSPVVFEKLYWLQRARLEKRMEAAAISMIEQASGR